VKSQKSTKIELGRLEELDLADVDVLERVDSVTSRLNLTANGLWDELSNQLVKSETMGLLSNNLHHLFADLTNLRALSIGGFLDLVVSLLGEGNDEEADKVVIGSLDGGVGLDESLPLADEGTKFVRGEVETVEVGQAVFALDFVDSELNLAESVVFILLEIGKRDFEDAALESVVGVFETGGAVDEGFADLSVLESGWSLHIIPVLLCERISSLL